MSLFWQIILWDDKELPTNEYSGKWPEQNSKVFKVEHAQSGKTINAQPKEQLADNLQFLNDFKCLLCLNSEILFEKTKSSSEFLTKWRNVATLVWMEPMGSCPATAVL